MMRTNDHWTCDRCKKTQTIAHGETASSWRQVTNHVLSQFHGKPPESHDLCPECSSKFWRWMRPLTYPDVVHTPDCPRNFLLFRGSDDGVLRCTGCDPVLREDDEELAEPGHNTVPTGDYL